jgi:DNA-binding response OmpR family regulator
MAGTNFILVVEDDPILKNLLGHTFAGKYQTLYASNGAEALALFAQYTPAIVLLDLMLPDMDGFTILQQIRARPDVSKDVPVIIVSNLGQQSDKDKAIGLGANDYIVKAEVEIEEIVNRIEKILGTTSAAPAGAPAVIIPTTAMPFVNTDPTVPEVVPMPTLSPDANVTFPAGPQPFVPPPTSINGSL